MSSYETSYSSDNTYGIPGSRRSQTALVHPRFLVMVGIGEYRGGCWQRNADSVDFESGDVPWLVPQICVDTWKSTLLEVERNITEKAERFQCPTPAY